MKLLILTILLACSFSLCLFSQGEKPLKSSPELVFKIGSSYKYLKDVNVPISYGFGVEAGVGNYFSISGDFVTSTGNDLRFTFVNPTIRYFPLKRSKAFFIYGGAGYFQVSAQEDQLTLGYPFDDDRGDTATGFVLNTGIGASTFVKENFYLGLFAGFGAVGDDDLGSPILETGVSFGYGF